MNRSDYTEDDARDALHHCNPGQPRREWVRILAAAKAAGLSFDDVLSWSASAPNFGGPRDVVTAWRGIRADGAIGAGTLYHEARAAGWKPRRSDEPPRPARPPLPPAAPRVVEPERPMFDTLSDYGRKVWGECVPLASTIGAAYLAARRCALPPEDGALRFHPARKHPLGDYTGPALVALVTDSITREPLSLHTTFICADGTKPAALPGPARLMLGRHRKAGGVIRLWPDEAVTMGLGVGEGVETCLSLAHAFRPVWSLIDAGNLRAFPVLAGVESLVIAQDNDPAGRAAAAECAARWVAAGCTVSIVSAAQDGADLNDITKKDAA